MNRYEPLVRRSFISQLGKGVLGIVVLGAGACSDEVTVTTAGMTSTSRAPLPTTTSGATSAAPTTTASPPTTVAPVAGGMAVTRVMLGSVSAYVLVRATEAVIVDTGVSGSAGTIEESLVSVGLGWGDVGHVILTHLHPDHIGSLGDVMAGASAAVGYAGAADIPGISSPRPLEPVGTGDSVFGLDIVSTPGHTPGHISVFDPIGKALITGDALNGLGSGVDGADAAGVGGPNPRFTPDMTTALSSVEVLATLRPDAVFFGHGEPLVQGAAAALETLAGQT